MAFFNAEAFQQALNADGEFKLAARFLDCALKLQFDDQAILFTFKEGQLTGMGTPSLFDTSTVAISGPAAAWRELLKPVPKPFFHDMFAAIVRRQFSWSGDSETFFAYYGAFRRMFQIMRQHANA